MTVIADALSERAQDLGFPRDRICKIQGGTFPDYFVDRSIDECRKRVGLSDDGPILAFSSADGHWDLDIVMKTLAIVARKHPKVQLMLTGQTSDLVRGMAREQGVEDRLILTGYLSKEDLPWHMGCADVFLLPFPDTLYNRGRWPNKLGDYMALGRPTVANGIGDVGPFFQRHDIGLLAECDSTDFADKVIRLLDDEALRQELGRSARETAEQYDYPKLIGKLDEFYTQLLEDASQPQTV